MSPRVEDSRQAALEAALAPLWGDEEEPRNTSSMVARGLQRRARIMADVGPVEAAFANAAAAGAWAALAEVEAVFPVESRGEAVQRRIVLLLRAADRARVHAGLAKTAQDPNIRAAHRIGAQARAVEAADIAAGLLMVADTCEDPDCQDPDCLSEDGIR